MARISASLKRYNSFLKGSNSSLRHASMKSLRSEGQAKVALVRISKVLQALKCLNHKSTHFKFKRKGETKAGRWLFNLIHRFKMWTIEEPWRGSRCSCKSIRLTKYWQGRVSKAGRVQTLNTSTNCSSSYHLIKRIQWTKTDSLRTVTSPLTVAEPRNINPTRVSFSWRSRSLRLVESAQEMA